LRTLKAITGKKAAFRSLADTTTPHGRMMLTVAPLADSRGNHRFVSGGDQNADVIEGFGGLGFPGGAARLSFSLG
jgi:hypothetical protein